MVQSVVTILKRDEFIMVKKNVSKRISYEASSKCRLLEELLEQGLGLDRLGRRI